jgi:phage terminase large subunit-like protein
MKDIEELAGIYHFNKASIDRYAKGWVENALKKIGLEVNIRPSLAEIYVNIKSLMLGNRLYLPDNQGIKKAFLNTQAYYGRNNALSIAHNRDSEGHADETDAIATAVFEINREIEQDTEKLLDEMSDNIKRSGDKRLSSQYVDEIGDVNNPSDWWGPGRPKPGGDW